MDQPILVAYASKHGATAEIAAKIAEVLNGAGKPTVLRPIAEVQDLASYGAIVFGSAVYAGHWRKEAAQFLEKHSKELAAMPVWLFSSGPTGDGKPVELLKGWVFPENLQRVAKKIGPRDTALFHGVLEPDSLNFAERLIIKGVKAPIGDFRDWDAITAWALHIAGELAPKR